MTDPLSITGSAVGIISLGLSVVQTLSNFIQTVAHARTELAVLEASLVDMKLVLNRLYDILYGPDTRLEGKDREVVEKLVLRCTDGFVDLHHRLSSFNKSTVDSKRKSSLQKLSWALKADDIEKVVQQLETMKSSLQLALQVSIDGKIARTEEGISEAQKTLKEHTTGLNVINESIISHQSGLLRCQDTIVKDITSHSTAQFIEIKDEFNTTSDALVDLREELQNGLRLVLSGLVENKDDIIRATSSFSDECQSNHSSNAVGYSRSQRKSIKQHTFEVPFSIFGTVFLSTTTTTISNKFSDFTAQRQKREWKMYYLPASWLFSKTFCVTFFASAWGVPWGLKFAVRRIVPYYHKAFELCEKGDIEGVQRLLARREILVSDVGSLNRWEERTLLHVAAENKHEELCRYLVSFEGADPSVRIGVWVPVNYTARCFRLVTASELWNPLAPLDVFGSCEGSNEAQFLFLSLRSLLNFNPLATENQILEVLSRFLTTPDSAYLTIFDTLEIIYGGLSTPPLNSFNCKSLVRKFLSHCTPEDICNYLWEIVGVDYRVTDESNPLKSHHVASFVEAFVESFTEKTSYAPIYPGAPLCLLWCSRISFIELCKAFSVGVVDEDGNNLYHMIAASCALSRDFFPSNEKIHPEIPLNEEEEYIWRFRYLSMLGAKVDAQNSYGVTPLQAYLINRQISNYENFDNQYICSYPPLKSIVGWVDQADLLTPQCGGFLPIHCAIACGDLQAVCYLFQQRYPTSEIKVGRGILAKVRSFMEEVPRRGAKTSLHDYWIRRLNATLGTWRPFLSTWKAEFMRRSETWLWFVPYQPHFLDQMMSEDTYIRDHSKFLEVDCIQALLDIALEEGRCQLPQGITPESLSLDTCTNKEERAEKLEKVLEHLKAHHARRKHQNAEKRYTKQTLFLLQRHGSRLPKQHRNNTGRKIPESKLQTRLFTLRNLRSRPLRPWFRRTNPANGTKPESFWRVSGRYLEVRISHRPRCTNVTEGQVEPGLTNQIYKKGTQREDGYASIGVRGFSFRAMVGVKGLFLVSLVVNFLLVLYVFGKGL